MVSLHGLGEIKRLTGNYSKAIEYCSQAVERSVKMKMIEREKSACKCLYKTYREIDNNDQAVVYLEKLRAIDDSLNLVETAKKLQSMEFEKQVFADSLHVEEEKRFLDQKHYEELKHQKLVRNAFMGGFAVVLLFAGVFLKQRNRIGQEKERSDELLLNILPEETATELKEKGHSDAQLIEQVTVLFTDFKGFTSLSEKVTPKELVADLHACFSQFDQICEKYGIEKIKTIGDAYMAAGGLPSPNNTHAKDVVQAALEMAQVVEKGKADKIAANLPFFEIRIGVHTGPVVAGIVGVKKFQYDIWGDSVNTASRMESSGEVGKVNISEATYELLKDDAQFSFESRGKIEAKGKGEMEMYFVSEKG
ncbi:MAG: adenylate/guanylate cyclase domain-containing protein [Flavobacteriales bacterium]